MGLGLYNIILTIWAVLPAGIFPFKLLEFKYITHFDQHVASKVRFGMVSLSDAPFVHNLPFSKVKITSTRCQKFRSQILRHINHVIYSSKKDKQ